MNEEVFKAAVRACSFISKEELNALWSKYTTSTDGWVTIEEARHMERDYPQFSRNTGAKILELVQNNGIRKLHNEIDFAADGLFCEWAWVIDFNKRTFEAYKGFCEDDAQPDDRFYFLKDKQENGYSIVKICASFSIDALPSNGDFLAAFVEDDEE